MRWNGILKNDGFGRMIISYDDIWCMRMNRNRIHVDSMIYESFIRILKIYSIFISIDQIFIWMDTYDLKYGKNGIDLQAWSIELIWNQMIIINDTTNHCILNINSIIMLINHSIPIDTSIIESYFKWWNVNQIEMNDHYLSKWKWIVIILNHSLFHSYQ